MREIFRSYRKVYLNDLLMSLTPFILVDYPIHNDIYNKYGIVHFVLKVVLTGKIYLKLCIFFIS